MINNMYILRLKIASKVNVFQQKLQCIRKYNINFRWIKFPATKQIFFSHGKNKFLCIFASKPYSWDGRTLSNVSYFII